jgi:hypothetical protein
MFILALMMEAASTSEMLIPIEDAGVQSFNIVDSVYVINHIKQVKIYEKFELFCSNWYLRFTSSVF